VPLGIQNGYQQKDDFALVFRYSLAQYEVSQYDYWCHLDVLGQWETECPSGEYSFRRLFFGDHVTSTRMATDRVAATDVFRVTRGMRIEFADDSNVCPQFKANITEYTAQAHAQHVYEVEMRMQFFERSATHEVVVPILSRFLEIFGTCSGLVTLGVTCFSLVYLSYPKNEVADQYKRTFRPAIYYDLLKPMLRKLRQLSARVLHGDEEEGEKSSLVVAEAPVVEATMLHSLLQRLDAQEEKMAQIQAQQGQVAVQQEDIEWLKQHLKQADWGSATTNPSNECPLEGLEGGTSCSFSGESTVHF